MQNINSNSHTFEKLSNNNTPVTPNGDDETCTNSMSLIINITLTSPDNKCNNIVNKNSNNVKDNNSVNDEPILNDEMSDNDSNSSNSDDMDKDIVFVDEFQTKNMTLSSHRHSISTSTAL